jgi:hypothetical protein
MWLRKPTNDDTVRRRLTSSSALRALLQTAFSSHSLRGTRRLLRGPVDFGQAVVWATESVVLVVLLRLARLRVTAGALGFP